MNRLTRFACVCLLLTAATRLLAWDYAGHRTINELALESLPADFPAFVHTPEARERIGFLAGEPDRWRNSKDDALKHFNNPDHYFDYEEILDAELKPEELSEFRYIFVHQWLAARAAHASSFPKIDPAKNADHTREFAGLLPWSIHDAYAKLRSEFSYLKAYEELGTPAEIENARANIIHQMGVMGHYVGDAAQPLHTTKFYNGWVGANPKGFTTSRKFHASIDGDFMNATGGVFASQLTTRLAPAHVIPLANPSDPRAPVFVATLAYIKAQNQKVAPLYELEKTGAFTKPDKSREGRAFIEDQYLAGAQMLASLWLTAWKEAPADDFLRNVLLERAAKNAERGRH